MTTGGGLTTTTGGGSKTCSKVPTIRAFSQDDDPACTRAVLKTLTKTTAMMRLLNFFMLTFLSNLLTS